MIRVRYEDGQPASGHVYTLFRERSPPLLYDDDFIPGPFSVGTGRVPPDGSIHLEGFESAGFLLFDHKLISESRFDFFRGRGTFDATLTDAGMLSMSVLIDGEAPEHRVSFNGELWETHDLLPNSLEDHGRFNKHSFWFYGLSSDTTGCVTAVGLDRVPEERRSWRWEGGFELDPRATNPFPITLPAGGRTLKLVSPLSVRGRLVDVHGEPVPDGVLLVKLKLRNGMSAASALRADESGAFRIPIRHRDLTLARFEDGQEQVDALFRVMKLQASSRELDSAGEASVTHLDAVHGADVGDVVLRAR